MKMLAVIFSVLIVQACTMYDIKRTMPDGSQIDVSIKSSRDLEQPNVEYSRIGDGAEFRFNAANVKDNSAAIQGNIMNTILQALLAGQLIVPEPE